MTHKLPKVVKILPCSIIPILLNSCSGVSGYGAYGSPNMGNDISTAERSLQISTEPTGNFYYGRRYHVNKTRFWGYLRKPRQSWAQSKLVIMNERVRSQPDRLPENGPKNFRHGNDQNFEYKITGNYTGQKIYDPNSNLFLPEFRATNYSVINRDPQWLFTPQDHYNPTSITLINSSVQRN